MAEDETQTTQTVIQDALFSDSPFEALEQVELNPEPDLSPDENAPYGYMIDQSTGQRRAKKRPGRQRKTPVAPVGGTSPVDFTEKIERGDDQPPGTNRDRSKKSKKTPKEPAPVPPFRAGPIASGMNKLYARIGKVVKVWDADIGNALIIVTRKESDDDTTVGEAWEEIARTNPRIRAFLLRMMEGSAWSSLFMAHAPIFLAILMKDSIRSRLPFNRLFSAFLDTDDDGPSEVSEALGGIQTPDLNEMMAFAMNNFGDMMAGMNLPRSAVIDPRGPAENPDMPASPESETA